MGNVASLRLQVQSLLVPLTPASQVPVKGVASDHELCTALGEGVLRDGGSSVDAAVAGSLCLGVVHPHVSGVGGCVSHFNLEMPVTHTADDKILIVKPAEEGSC